MYRLQDSMDPHLLDLSPAQLWHHLIEATFIAEDQIAKQLVLLYQPDAAHEKKIEQTAYQCVMRLRSQVSNLSYIEQLFQNYDLSTDEGIALMSLSEALIRIPDRENKILFIRDKISSMTFDEAHQFKIDTLFANASKWSLLLTDKILNFKTHDHHVLSSFLNLGKKLSSHAIEQVMRLSMQWIGQHFILGETIPQAIKKMSPTSSYAFDMLGEAAVIQKDAQRYYQDYFDMIDRVAKLNHAHENSVSIKLTALFPRYEALQQTRIHAEMIPQLINLVEFAMEKMLPLRLMQKRAIA